VIFFSSNPYFVIIIPLFGIITSYEILYSLFVRGSLFPENTLSFYALVGIADDGRISRAECVSAKYTDYTSNIHTVGLFGPYNQY
jgi:hypothetical protein